MQKGILLFGAVLLLAACTKNSDQEPGPTPPEPPVAHDPWADPTATNIKGATYINNGEIQLGVDMKQGGAIFHFSEVMTKKNVLNHVDAGRFVQQSYYGEPDGSNWNGTPWVWNPIQGGGSNNKTKAEVTDSKITGTTISVTSIPVLWASSVPEKNCRMQEKISLNGRVAHIHYMMVNRGATATSHDKTQQEVPAVFVDWGMQNYVFYAGDKPWTNDKLTSVIPNRHDLTGKNEEFNRDEHWAAYVNDQGWGVGVYTPGTRLSTTYIFGSGPAGPMSGACSYFAPLRVFAIEKNGVYEYDVYMMIGQIEEIRAAFYKIREEKHKND